MNRYSLFFLTIFLVQNVHSASIKMRAREHVTYHEIHSSSQIQIYKGLTNTINIWWEEPYEYSFGISFMPVLAGLRSAKDSNTFGDKVTHQNIGLEYKFYPKIISDWLFLRPGLGYSMLETNGHNTKDYHGKFAYLGVGVEIPYDRLGMAIEMAARYSDYDDIYMKSITPSIGFHFYKDI